MYVHGTLGSPGTGVIDSYSHQVGAENRTPVVCKSSQCSELLNHLCSSLELESSKAKVKLG